MKTHRKEAKMRRTFKKVTKPFRYISDAINKLPLAGKLAIKPTLFWAYKATTRKEKFIRISLALLLLIILIFFHYIQMESGWEIYIKTQVVVLQVIGITYAVVNAAVIYTQGVLSLRVLKIVSRSPKRSPCRLHCKPYSFGYVMLCGVVTFGGQVIFGIAQVLV